MIASKLENTLNHLRRIRYSIYVYTIVQLMLFLYCMVWEDGYSTIIYGNPWYLLVLTPGAFISIYAIWFTWVKLPSRHPNKWWDTFLLLFGGIIGQWLWLPSSNRVKNLIKRENRSLFKRQL